MVGWDSSIPTLVSTHYMFLSQSRIPHGGLRNRRQRPIADIRKFTADMEGNRNDIFESQDPAVPTISCLARRLEKNLRDFPDRAQKLLGDELQLIQFGGMPKDAKPFKGVGSGIVEIALRYASDAYRVVLPLQIGSRIYILHSFQKKSKRGIATPKRDVDLIKEAIRGSEGVGS
jgi:phage-related protein